jgi:hypothetical protein
MGLGSDLLCRRPGCDGRVPVHRYPSLQRKYCSAECSRWAKRQTLVSAHTSPNYIAYKTRRAERKTARLSARYIYNCENCGAEYVVVSERTQRERHPRHCSKACADRGRARTQKVFWSRKSPAVRLAHGFKTRRWHHKRCKNCGNEFTVPSRKRGIKFCSPACNKEGFSKSQRESWTPERRQKNSEQAVAKNAIRWADPHERAKLSERNRQQWRTNPQYVKNVIEASRRAMLACWQDPEWRHLAIQRSASQLRKLTSDPKFRYRTGERMRRKFLLAEVARQLLELQGIELWEEPAKGAVEQLRRLHVLGDVGEHLIKHYGGEL